MPQAVPIPFHYHHQPIASPTLPNSINSPVLISRNSVGVAIILSCSGDGGVNVSAPDEAGLDDPARLEEPVVGALDESDVVNVGAAWLLDVPIPERAVEILTVC